MNLFIDTHLDDIIIILFKNNEILKKEIVTGEKQNSKLIMPTIEKVLENKTPESIIVCNGPGSFTGVRLGVTIAKTLAYTLEIPIRTVSSLELLAISLKDVDTKIQTYSTYLKGPEGELAEETKQSLGRIIDLCEENHVELVFFVAPYMVSEGEAIGYANIKKWLEEKGVSFLDMNNHIDEIGITWESDMCDIGHANYWGAAKNSEWLGRFLKDNYDIPDRRADSKYENWNKCNQVLDILLLKDSLEKEVSLEEVAKILNQHKEKLIISMIAGEYAGKKEITILENNGFGIGMNNAIYIENGVHNSKYETMEKVIRVDNDVYFGKDDGEKVFCQMKNEYLASDAIGIIVYSDVLGEVIYLKEHRSEEMLSE